MLTIRRMQTSLWNFRTECHIPFSHGMSQLRVMQGIFRHLTALDLGQHHLGEGE
jgi:hypothetical protein